jgi:hypothetical protein
MAQFKRSLFGYRRSEVDEAIAARDEALAKEKERAAGLEDVSRRLAERVVERERALARLRQELAGERERSAEAVRAIAALADDLEAMRRLARGQATRIRVAALRQAAEVNKRVAAIGDAPSETLVTALAGAVDRLGAEDDRELEAEANGYGRIALPEDLFEGMVEVEIGPLADFSQLVGFEDAARSIAATSELSITRFSEGRATLAVNLKEPVELLRELEERCDLEFQVRDRRADRLVLDVGNEERG